MILCTVYADAVAYVFFDISLSYYVANVRNEIAEFIVVHIEVWCYVNSFAVLYSESYTVLSTW